MTMPPTDHQAIRDAAERINEGFRQIAAARKKAGVAPGEPLLGLSFEGVSDDDYERD